MNVSIFAPAKINLTLEVGAPRADGYHPLQSLVMFADIGDRVDARMAEALTLDLSGPFAANLDGDNLVLKAACALAERFGVAKGAALRLEKNLPVASGIGGGSSDAAASLKALDRLWGLNLGLGDLHTLARELGADVPVCMLGRSAWMSGIGEALVALNAPPLAAVLVNPLQPLPTGLVFRAFDAMRPSACLVETPAPEFASASSVIAFARARGNDLANAARALMPELEIMECALNNDARVMHAGLSGSGATMYALVASVEAAQALADDLARAHRHWWVRATTLT